MDDSSTPEVLIILFSKYISFPVFSSSLSSPPASELSDMMPQIEEDIKESGDEKETDGEREANDEMEDNNARRRKIAKMYSRI